MSDIPTHVRTITIEAYDDPRGHRLEATLRDERPWAQEGQVHTLHSMGLQVIVDATTLTITEAAATMHQFPHEECPGIEAAFQQLVGLSVMRGYNKAVQERLGRERGCTHLEFLARANGPAVIQTLASSRGRHGNDIVAGEQSGTAANWLANSCHIWADDGPGTAKIREGWRPGTTEYPTPSLVELRRRRHEA